MASSKFKKTYPLVCIEWEDACFHTGYYNSDKPDEWSTAMCRTVGHLLQNSKKEVRTAKEIFQDGQARDVIAIPKGMVRKITYLVTKAEPH